MSTKNETIAEKQVKLQTILGWFEGDDFQVESASEKFAEAKKIAQEIDSILSEQQNKITELAKSFSDQ
ncbi:hypothetical protein CR956_01680 [Candidatus Saccharibacteria bacterium]|nr:MAG: hypothetical protein CR956_01680 [Candidatus Saccharibacteria bacterium]